jgi:GNAT superfamily N-acetyltransferase
MADLLVRLYDLPEFPAEARVKEAGITIRRAIGPEAHVVIDFVRQHFSMAWVSEVQIALTQQPPTLFVAIKQDKLIGFAAYDTSAKGFFGPTGVLESARGQGIGEALLIRTLRAMRDAGYAYAVIGDPGPVEFYKKRLDVLEIPASDPGHYAGMLRG